MKPNFIGADDLISTFAQQRQVLLKHTADLLCGETTPVRHAVIEREAKLSAILVSSLEELKVAEEELVERTQALAAIRDDLEERVRGARQLFELAPSCLLVTDSFGNILEVNRAARQLLKRDFAQLERKPFTTFIPPDDRRPFRDALARLAQTGTVTDWRLELVRPTDAPVSVSIAVNVLEDAGGSAQTRFLWAIRQVEVAPPPKR